MARERSLAVVAQVAEADCIRVLCSSNVVSRAVCSSPRQLWNLVKGLCGVGSGWSGLLVGAMQLDVQPGLILPAQTDTVTQGSTEQLSDLVKTSNADGLVLSKSRSKGSMG